MSSVNLVIILGNLGKDPELRHTGKGKSVCNFSVATSESWVDDNGEKQEETEWSRVVVWGRQAENCVKYLEKGSQVYIEGKNKTRKWQDNNGQDRYTTEVVARRVNFLGGLREQGDRNTRGYSDAGSDSIPF